MADVIDRANDLADEMVTRSIALSSSKGLEVVATGKCLWCGENVPADQRWCDADCRDDWQKNRKGR